MKGSEKREFRASENSINMREKSKYPAQGNARPRGNSNPLEQSIKSCLEYTFDLVKEECPSLFYMKIGSDTEGTCKYMFQSIHARVNWGTKDQAQLDPWLLPRV